MSDVKMVATYLKFLLTPDGLRDNIKRTVKALRPWASEFDCIAFRGMSGAVVGPSAACLLDKHSIMVRKRDGGHSSMAVEGPRNLDRYVIVDDLVQSGTTIRVIQEQVLEFNPQAKCVGVCLYNGDGHFAEALNYFRDHKDLKWIQAGDLESRAERLYKWAEGKSCFSKTEMWLSVTFGANPHMPEKIPALEACFPRQEERAAVRRTEGWAKLQALVKRRLAAEEKVQEVHKVWDEAAKMSTVSFTLNGVAVGPTFESLLKARFAP